MTSLQLGDYDKDGELASNGTINHSIKEELMSILEICNTQGPMI